MNAGRASQGARHTLDRAANRPTLAPMAMDNLVAPLLRLPLFAGLKPLQLTEIVHRAERLRFWPGDLLTKAGQPGDGAYLIVSGPAQRVAGPGLAAWPAGAVVPGSLIGEMAMLVEHDYGSTIVARDRVFCLKLMRTAMHAQMREDATLAEHFHDRLTERLLQTAEELRRIDRCPRCAQSRDLATGDRRNSWPQPAGTADARQRQRQASQTGRTKRNAPNPGGGVGREKRVMRMVPGGNPAPQAMSFG